MAIRVLVADDDPEILAAVSEALDRRGCWVVRATSGGELVDALAREGPFDLVVTDVTMPWMDGLKAMRSMRMAGVATPVIVMSAVAGQQLPADVQALGAGTVFLRKPFDIDALEAAVATLVPLETAQ